MHNSQEFKSDFSGIECINPVEVKNWNDLISAYCNSSFFHTSEWCETMIKSYNFKPFYLVENNITATNIYPFMGVKNILGKNKLVSLPFSDYCDPLSRGRIYYKNKLPEITSYFKNSKYPKIEFTTCTEYNESNCITKSGAIQKVNLKIPSELYKSFDHSTRGNINKAEKNSIKIKFDNTLSGLNDFYLLQCICRKRHCLPPQPISFFEKLFNTVFSKNMGDILLAYHKNKIIASGLFLKFNKKVIFKYSNSDFNYQQLRPSNLLTWEAMKFYSENGYKEFDFGRTDGEHDGLYRFKKGYNSSEIPLFHFRYYLNKNTVETKSNINNSIAKYVLKYAPINHLKFMGKHIYKYFA